MTFRIVSNISSMIAQHSLGKSSRALESSLEKLSTGFKVNRGADGPAALVISEKQRAQIAGLTQAIDNAEKGISMVQTAEGALTEINALLIKIRSLAIDSANTAVNDDDALQANQDEIDNALDTIRRIAENTQFGTKRLLDGSLGVDGTTSSPDVTFIRGTSTTQSGAYTIVVSQAAERAVVESNALQTAVLDADEVLRVNNVTITLPAGLDQAGVIDRINSFSNETGVVADDDTADGRTRLYSVRFGSLASIEVSSDRADSDDSTKFGTTVLSDSGLDVAGQIDGYDFAGSGDVATAVTGDALGVTLRFAESAGDLSTTVSGNLGNVSIDDHALVFQIGPNQYQTAKVAIEGLLPSELALNNESGLFDSLAEVDVRSADGAQGAISVIDVAIDEVTTLRGFLGAFQQNTLESTANSLRVTLENTTNAESVIRNTDFAEEIANFTKQQVLVQAGTSMLSSANQTAQLALSLLN